MKNYKRIRRIFETTEPMQPEVQPAEQFPTQPMATEAPPAPVEPMVPAQPALPPAGASSAAPDPMTMTVNDFLNKVRTLDPLVAMGIESYIEKNMGSFTEPQMTPTAPMAQEPDLSFSSQVPAPEPTLDFPVA